MEKYTLKQLKNLYAENITTLSNEEIKALKDFENGLETIGYSMGIYGINGALLKGYKTGKMYVVTARNSNLFYLI